MKIGIDCRLAGHRHAGIGRYIENLITRLPILEPDIEWVYFFHDQTQVDDIIKTLNSSAQKSFHKVQIVLTPIRHYSLSEQLTLPSYFNNAKLDLLHVPHFNVPIWYGGRLLVTIHDLLWHEYRGQGVTTLNPAIYWLKYLGYRLVAHRAIKHAQKLFVPAETIKKTLTKLYPQTQSKIVVTKEGSSHTFGLPNKNLTKSTASKNIVYVGSLYPHKNLNLVITALKDLPDHTLTIVGSRNVFQDNIRAFVKAQGVTDQVSFSGFLSDQELQALLHRSLALVQPSFSEGFGLTGVEAMAAGVPVLASDIPIFKEIYQNGAVYFDPYSTDSFVKAVCELEKNNRDQLITRGLKVATQYSWEHMTKQTLAEYKKSLA